ncbi:uncharacterized protein RCO7_11748 [Rhynchosporium graminicola]|uniref:Uncharacterized protein n=1 Tax=Rhynchosporium graminicola TaxID=2792576 RepID=A0A1E1KJH3_9HELO|nr:uncharacterized protein RCO7_11748 [Rhynchosporium commune]
MNLGPIIYSSSYIIFSTILVIASKSGNCDIASGLLNYVNIEYTILSSLLLSGEAKDAELNRGGIIATYKAINQIYYLMKSATLITIIIREFAKKAIFKAIISNTKGKRNLPSSLEIALDLDTLRPSLKKKAYRISYYTRSTTRAILVDLDKELDIVVLVPDIPDLLEALENLREKASKVEVIKEVEF